VNNAVTLTMAEAFRRAGLAMDVPSMDWATLTQRRNRREAQDQGGWNLFVTIANVLDAQKPADQPLSGEPLRGWPRRLALRRGARSASAAPGGKSPIRRSAAPC
jgi:peptide/nickel transport system substrate-binding protein